MPVSANGKVKMNSWFDGPDDAKGLQEAAKHGHLIALLP